MRELKVWIILSCFLTALFLLVGNPQNITGISLLILIILIPVGILARKQDPFWVSSLILITYLVMVILAFQQSGNRYLLTGGCISSLAAWDLFLFRNTLKGDLSLNPVDHLIHSHLKSLGKGLFMSVLGGLLALTLPIRLPFYMLFLLSLIALISFFQLLTGVWKKKSGL
jgi:hypothetical protein